MIQNHQEHAHFEGKGAKNHVAEVKARGILSSNELHGFELPGHLSSGTDAAKDSAIFLLFSSFLLLQFNVVEWFFSLAIIGIGWVIWKMGRSALLGWSRLERMHRILEQEKYEIEHHRPQEREELKILYSMKGFEGKLLDEVVDVLMADNDRLLKVMVEEELGLSLESQEHPLKQCLGACLGSLFALIACLLSGFLFQITGLFFAALFTIIFSSALSARYIQNRSIPAIVWNVGLTILSFGMIIFLFQYIS